MTRLITITIDVHDDHWFEGSAHFASDAKPAERQYAADMVRFFLTRFGHDARVETLSQMQCGAVRSDGAAKQGEDD